MKYNVSKKIDGKWKNFGRIETNKFGNLSLSFRNTQEFKDFITSQGDWVNFALFPAEERIEGGLRKDAGPPKDDSEVPF